MTETPLPAVHRIDAPAGTHCPANRQTHPTLPLMRMLPLAVLALLAGLGTVSWLNHMGEVSVVGYLNAEQCVVYAPRTGRVERVAARTGDAVKPHQLLIQLTDDSLDREIAAQARQVQSLEASLEQCRAKADVQLSLEFKSLSEELHRTRIQSAELLREHYAASFEHASWRSFTKQLNTGRCLPVGLDSMNEPDRIFDHVETSEEIRLRAVMRQESARNSAEVKKAQSELCDHHIQELQELRENLPEKIRKAAGVDVAEANLAQASEQLNSLNHQKTGMAITARSHGLVGSYAKQAADPVVAGEPLVTVLDRDRPFVEFEVPSRDVGRLKLGQTLRLDFAGEDRKGRVEAIAPQALRHEKGSESWIAVRISPAGRLWPSVPVGSAVSVRLK